MQTINKICSLSLVLRTSKKYIRNYVHPSNFLKKLDINVNKIKRLGCRKPLLYNVILSASLLTWLGFKEDEDKESELIITLKRSVLCIQRKEFVKAEQMLHLALRIAQEQNNPDGITYAYDLLANLALEREQYDKSEKLFINVLQRLLSTGISEEDLKVVHISLKLARICQMKKEFEKAEIGYKWCLDTIKKYLDNGDYDALALHGIISDWYANFLIQNGNCKEALQYLEEAYKIYSGIAGSNNEKSVLLLNDLGTIHWQSGNYDIANEHLSKALKIGKTLDDFKDIGVIYANMGLVKLKLGLLNEAKKFCKEGWSIGHKQKNNEAINQANYCFEQINSKI